MEKPYHSRDVLIKDYRERGLSTPEIAEKYDVSAKTIQNWMRKHEIQIIRHLTMRMTPKGYERFGCQIGDKRKYIYVHRLLAISEFGFDEVADKDVHHENGIPWDNRSENISVLDKESHGKLHG